MPLPGRTRRTAPATTDVLVVCTGNICRSPYLAARLAAALPGLTVRSAGTGAVVDAPASPEILAALARHGVDASAHRGRQLGVREIDAARLIVTAERAHRMAVVQLVPSAVQRTVTAIELASLLATSGPIGLDAVLDRLRAAPACEADTDLADPYGLGQDAYDAMTTEADAVLAVLVPALGGPAAAACG